MITLRPQSPDDWLDSCIPFDRRLQPGETLSGTPTVTASPAGLTIGTASITGSGMTVWLGGGAPRTLYALTCVAQTSAGRTVERQARLYVGTVGLDEPAAC